MPSINLRLTEEQHAELEKWAHDGHRSLQKEIIWRLFTHSFFATTVEEAEKRATDEMHLATGRDDLTVKFDTEPLLPPTFPGGRTKGGPDLKPGQKK